ncbi:MAG: hypothetical protein IT345_10505 [Trueperaceae bacterium]|nr:hypothetical protein [Trueperaceae bacterium]
MTNVSSTLAAIATATPQSQGIRNMIQEENPILDYLQFATVPQGDPSFVWHEETQQGTAAFRALNGSWTPNNGQFVPKNEPLAILGGEVAWDIAINRRYGNSMPTFMADLIKQKSRAAYRKFEEAIFEGDVGVDPNSFDGLRVRCTERGMEFKISTGTDRDELTLAKLDEILDAVVGAKTIHLNQWLKRKVNALMRAAGQAREMVGSDFGRQFEAYAGAPLIVQQRLNDMSTILDFDEDPGDAGDDSASIYVCHWGTPEEENAAIALIGAGASWDPYGIPEDFEAPQEKTRLEVDCGMALIGNRGAARLYGVGKI